MWWSAEAWLTPCVGITTKDVFTEEQALALLFEGESNRSIAEHMLNSHSNRSHCIFTVYIEVTSLTCVIYDCSHEAFQSQSKVESNASARIAKLNFVDLAGSERVAKTQVAHTHRYYCGGLILCVQAEGATLKEAAYINRSLSFLEQVCPEELLHTSFFTECRLSLPLRTASVIMCPFAKAN